MKNGWNEQERLEALRAYEVLDTPYEADFDDIVKIASHICNSPISLVSLIDADRQWFKAKVGTDLQETPLDLSICSQAILQPGILEVPDTSVDPRFMTNPLVTGAPHIRFYAGAVLETPEGLPLGALCVIDYKARELTEDQRNMLSALARQVMAQLQLRRSLREQEEAKTALAWQNEILDQTIQHRTAKLQETIAELEAFSFSISHDMRSPLRAMQGYSDALLQDYGEKLDAEAVNYLNRIHRGASRLDLLIRDVLAYSKVARGEVEMGPVELEPLLADIIENYPDLHSGKMKVIVGTIPKLWAHEGLLTQIVSNLLGNAAKFTSEGTFPSVNVFAEPAGDEVKIYFEDNGIGIDPSHHRQIFQIFGRVYPDKLYEGTGIGLAVVRKAAERMGGTCGVDAVEGSGSRFWITLKKFL